MKKRLLVLILIFYIGLTHGQVAIENISYTEESYSDLEFLKDELEGKRIVCLGEEWHFTETFSQIKNRLVKYLNKELGYNVILFESSFQGALIAETENLKSKERLFETVQTIWRTESVLDLMEYISKSKEKENVIYQYGFDLYGTYTDRFKDSFGNFLELNYPKLKKEILAIDSKVQEDYIKKHQGIGKFKTQLKSEELEQYQHLLSTMQVNIDNLNYGHNKKTLLKAIENRILLGESLVKEDMYFREKIMAENIEWILDQLDEEDKVLIWAADIHISKSQKKTVKDGDKSMIERLPEDIKKTVYSLSLIPIGSAPKKIKKELNNRNERFFFFQLNKDDKIINRGDEFDGMIICKDVERIENYKVK